MDNWKEGDEAYVKVRIVAKADTGANAEHFVSFLRQGRENVGWFDSLDLIPIPSAPPVMAGAQQVRIETVEMVSSEPLSGEPAPPCYRVVIGPQERCFDFDTEQEAANLRRAIEGALAVPPAWPPVMAGAVTGEMIEAACKADLPDLWSDDPRTAHMAASPLRLECVRGEHRKGVANVLTAALSVARADGWRPIETAPKDGSDVELLLQNGEQFKVRWNTERYCVLGPRAGSYPPGWSAASTEDVDANLPISFAGNEPTHWRSAAISVAPGRADGWTRLSAENARLRTLLTPFAEAAAGLENEPDRTEMWEHPCAMQITAGHLRAAAGLSAPIPGEMASQAARDVLAERRRQIEVEGWTAQHDEKHETGAIAMAAACYAIQAGYRWFWPKDNYRRAQPPRADVAGSGTGWPWDLKWWKPKSPREDLVRAGALIIAEIESIDRAAPPALTGEK